ncbi:MAG: kelch repeat-containing protein [Thermoplasmata archaeon]
MTPSISPPKLYNPHLSYEMVYDEYLKKMVLFGNDETWTYDVKSNVWTNITSEIRPYARGLHAFAYDLVNKAAVLFGGWNSSARFGDVWIFDSVNRSWSCRKMVQYPRPRNRHTIGYDERNQLVVIFGGFDEWRGIITLNDVWTYETSTNTWTYIPAPDPPPTRHDHGMVYDCRNGEFIIFGGEHREISPKIYISESVLNDTWSFNLSTRTWKNLTPIISPKSRCHHLMVYDSSHHEIVLYGGIGQWDALYRDTWIFNISTCTWKEVTPATSPFWDPHHETIAFAFDPQSNLCVMIGNYTFGIWLYDYYNNIWIQRTNPFSQIRGIYRAIIDSKRNQLIFEVNGDEPTEMWTYDVRNDSLRKIWGSSQFIGIVGWWYPAYDALNDAIVSFWGYDVYIDFRGYISSGVYTSPSFWAGGEAYFGRISWEGTVPEGTSIKLQLRSAKTLEELERAPFVGPDGSAGTFYRRSGEAVSSAHNGSSRFQYRAYLETSSHTLTPVLKSVTINYNIIHNLTVLLPATGDVWTGEKEIAWLASDADNDSLSFDIYLERGPEIAALVTGLPNETRKWLWNTSEIPNGTYRILIVARDNNPSIPLSVSASSEEFAIRHPSPPNHPPLVTLVFPPNNSIINSTTAELMWNGTDFDGDALNYSVYQSENPVFDNTTGVIKTNETSVVLEGLKDLTTYYWSVDAWDGKAGCTGFPLEVWSFTVRLPPANRLPRIAPIPALSVMAGEELIYNVTATDEDGDALVFSLIQGPSNLSIDSGTGRLRWKPEPSDAGSHNATVRVSDGRGGEDEQSFSITVLPPPPPQKPTCRITHPANGTRVSGRIQVRGTAADGALALVSVQVRVDGRTWLEAEGLHNWSCSLDTKKLSNGRHCVEARAFDSKFYSEAASIDLLVTNPGPGVSMDRPPWTLPLVIMAATITVGIYLAVRRRTRE